MPEPQEHDKNLGFEIGTTKGQVLDHKPRGALLAHSAAVLCVRKSVLLSVAGAVVS